MIEVYDPKERKYIMILLEIEDEYVSQEDWDKYYWEQIEEQETYIPRR